MIIIKVMGGLGNQLQQYALYEKFRALGKETKLDISWFEDAAQQEKVLAKRSLELRQFDNLQFEKASREECEALLGKGALSGAGGLSGLTGFLGKMKRKLNPASDKHFYETDMYHPEIFSFTDRYLEGTGPVRNTIMILCPCCGRRSASRKAEILRISVRWSGWEPQENSVGVHIRRGDYLDPENAGMFGGICTDAYYETAINYVREQLPDAHFYMFSDDPAYLKEHFQGAEYTIVDWNRGADSFFDCELMSRCRANICANSTFSFWEQTERTGG